MNRAQLLSTLALLAAMFSGTLSLSAAAPPAVVKAQGTLEPDTAVDVNAQVSGTIEKIEHAEFGERVKKGDVLAEIDSRTYANAAEQVQAAIRAAESDVALAKAQVALAELELQRCTIRAADKTADPLDVDVAKAALEVAKAKVQTAQAAVEEEKLKYVPAKINYDACRICSPIDGTIIVRRVNVGQYVAPAANSPSMFLVADDSKMSIWATIGEAHIADIKVGMPIQATFDAVPGKKYSGRISQIRLNAAMQQNEVIYTVIIAVDQKDSQLLPYMMAHVELSPGEQK